MTTRMMTRSQFLGSLGVGFALFACKTSDDTTDDQTTDDTDEPADDDQPTGDDDDMMATPDGSVPTDSAPRVCATPMAMIGTNHGHAIVVPVTDVRDRQEKTYDISGKSLHPHTVTVTPAMFAMIEAGQTVTVASSTDAGHSHQVTITC